MGVGRVVHLDDLGDAFGLGGLLGDGADAFTGDQDMDLAAYLLGRAQAHGLIVRALGDRIAFSPPLVISGEEIDEMFARFRRALDDTARWVGLMT